MTTEPASKSGGLVLAEEAQGVAVCTLNRPEALNALSSAMIAGLLGHLERLDRDPGVRAVVLAGAGKAFAAGADIKEMSGATAADMRRRDYTGPWERVGRFSKPLIAAVRGYALGGGCELAMSCDLIVAAEDASFGQPEVRIGVMPGAGGTQRLPRAVGAARAMELLLTGRRFGAREALDWGLVNRVVPADKVLEEAVALAREIAQLAPVAVREIKASVRAGLDLPLPAALAQERERFYGLFDTKDQKEGMAAFVEKRKPSFQGS